MANFTGDAVIAARNFTGDATLVGPRQRHNRTTDHEGTQDDTTVVLSAAIGPYAAGTTVHDYLVALTARLTALEDNVRYWGTFTGNAYIALHWLGNAVLKKTISGTLTGDAVITHGGSFTGNAVIRGEYTFTGDAFLV